MNLDHLLAMHLAPLFILQGCDDVPRLGVDNLSGRGKTVRSIQAESYPAWLFTQRNAGDLCGRLGGHVEHVQAIVVPITQPDLFFIGRQPDAMARTAMTLHGATGEVLHLDAS